MDDSIDMANQINKEIESILNGFSTSFWLKNTLQSLLKRDPVDAINDAEILLKLIRAKHRNVFISCSPQKTND